MRCTRGKAWPRPAPFLPRVCLVVSQLEVTPSHLSLAGKVIWIGLDRSRNP